MLPLSVSNPSKFDPQDLSVKNPSISDKKPVLIDTLFDNCDYDFEQVSSVIDPILTVQKRCQMTSLYVQGVITNQSTFLATNLNPSQETCLTQRGCNWLLGSSPNCAIAVPHQEVSRCHAVIGYSNDLGFYLTDIGSDTGTRVNRGLLAPLERRALRDGDIVELGKLWIEFFINFCGQIEPQKEDETRY